MSNSHVPNQNRGSYIRGTIAAYSLLASGDSEWNQSILPTVALSVAIRGVKELQHRQAASVMGAASGSGARCADECQRGRLSRVDGSEATICVGVFGHPPFLSHAW
jgi:hypothetical protein